MQVVLEGSAKWPNDRRAIARLKTAFQLKIAEYLKGLEYSVVVAEVDGVRVWKEGYCFLVQVRNCSRTFFNTVLNVARFTD